MKTGIYKLVETWKLTTLQHRFIEIICRMKVIINREIYQS